jgi:AraC-like DNA-binding protein
MRFTPYRVAPALAPYVELVWMLEGTATYGSETVLPNGAVELIVNLGSPHKVVDPKNSWATVFRESWIAGMQQAPLTIQAVRESNLVGIRFRPGGCRPFLGSPLTEITDQVIEASELFGPFIERLCERVGRALSPHERLQAIEAALLERIGSIAVDPLAERAVAMLAGSGGRVRTRRVADLLGTTEKTLISRFSRAVGVTPKVFARITRLQGVIRAVSNQTRPDWADVALACGYFDQSHLINDFRRLSGTTPEDYIHRRDADENHMVAG